MRQFDVAQDVPPANDAGQEAGCLVSRVQRELGFAVSYFGLHRSRR